MDKIEAAEKLVILLTEMQAGGILESKRCVDYDTFQPLMLVKFEGAGVSFQGVIDMSPIMENQFAS